jgi:hypothetical protein
MVEERGTPLPSQVLKVREPYTVRLEAGFAVFIVGVFPPQGGSESVIWEIGVPARGPRMTLGLDIKDRLFFDIVDKKGTHHHFVPDDSAPLERAVLIICEVIPGAVALAASDRREWEARVTINDCKVGSFPFVADLDGTFSVEQSVGADLDSRRGMSGAIAELIVFGRELTRDEHAHLWSSLSEKFALAPHST